MGLIPEFLVKFTHSALAARLEVRAPVGRSGARRAQGKGITPWGRPRPQGGGGGDWGGHHLTTTTTTHTTTTSPPLSLPNPGAATRPPSWPETVPREGGGRVGWGGAPLPSPRMEDHHLTTTTTHTTTHTHTTCLELEGGSVRRLALLSPPTC